MSYRVLSAADRERLSDPASDFAFAVLDGLSRSPKQLSSRYIYDAEGSRLFQEICELEEYYLTRCEHEILRDHAEAILAETGSGPVTLLDLGAGDGQKTCRILDALQEAGRACRYVPIDISEAAMAGLSEDMESRYPEFRVDGIVAEYFDGLRWLGEENEDATRLVLFLGSNIGNMNRPQARTFLRKLWSVLRSGDSVLIGFDLKKDIERLLAAYNDRQGVTAAFNLNLLSRINSRLGGHFDLASFRHFSTYNVFSGAMESYLVSLREQEVAIDILDSRFRFRAWEPIHTEYSYKYLHSDVERLAREAGFEVRGTYEDSERQFLDSLWQVRK